MLSETILEHTQDSTNITGSSVSSPPAPTIPDTSHSSTLIASPNEQQQSPQSDNETNSQKADVQKEDENLNVKRQEDILEDVGESDKEKLTKEHDEKEQLSPPPESLQESADRTIADLTDSVESKENKNTVVDSPASSVDDSVENVPTGGTVTPSVEDMTPTVNISSPWENVDSVEGSALREALSLMDNLEGDSDSDSSGEDIIVCDVSDSKDSEIHSLRGE